jgi:hypothetical protein
MAADLRNGHTIPELISEDKQPYYNALEAADQTFADDPTKFDFEDLEALMSALPAQQLRLIYDRAVEGDSKGQP